MNRLQKLLLIFFTINRLDVFLYLSFNSTSYSQINKFSHTDIHLLADTSLLQMHKYCRPASDE